MRVSTLVISSKHCRGLAGGLAAIVLGGLIFAACSTLDRTVEVFPVVAGASFVGNRACFECHTNYVRTFPATPHARLRLDRVTQLAETGCEACHGPGSKHVEVGGGRGRFIVNPRRNPDTCFGCHLQVQAEFHLPQHHPVVEGRMNCAQCHDPHGRDILKPASGLGLARLNESCATCHREQTKPHVFEHEAMREGCVICHQAHGSINGKLLTDRDNNLCLRCHAQSPSALPQNAQRIFIGREDHTGKIRMGGCYSAGCHTAVHGSDIDRRLLY